MEGCGALLAQMFATFFPARVKSLVLTNAFISTQLFNEKRVLVVGGDDHRERHSAIDLIVSNQGEKGLDEE